MWMLSKSCLIAVSYLIAPAKSLSMKDLSTNDRDYFDPEQHRSLRPGLRMLTQVANL